MSQADQALNSLSSTSSSKGSSPVASPCIDICELDDDNICVGCYRSIEEIVDWGMLDDTEKSVIIELANTRKKLLNKS